MKNLKFVTANLPHKEKKKKKNPWPESASELYRPSDRRFYAKLVPTFADRRVSRFQCSGFPTSVFSFPRPEI
jgi:hypothetical protein